MSYRVRWTEKYTFGTFEIIGDYSDEGGWDFAEQYADEIKWFPMQATPELIAKAEAYNQKVSA